MPRTLQTAAPQLPIRKNEEVGHFMLAEAPRFREKTKFQSAYLMSCIDVDTGELFGFMYSANGFRAQQCEQLVKAFASSSEPIGPLELVKVSPEAGGNWFWDMRDVSPNGKPASE